MKFLYTCAKAVAYAMMWIFFCAEAAAMMKKCPHIYLWEAKLGRLVYHIQETSLRDNDDEIWALLSQICWHECWGQWFLFLFFELFQWSLTFAMCSWHKSTTTTLLLLVLLLLLLLLDGWRSYYMMDEGLTTWWLKDLLLLLLLLLYLYSYSYFFHLVLTTITLTTFLWWGSGDDEEMSQYLWVVN